MNNRYTQRKAKTTIRTCHNIKERHRKSKRNIQNTQENQRQLKNIKENQRTAKNIKENQTISKIKDNHKKMNISLESRFRNEH